MKKLKTSRIAFQVNEDFKQQLMEYCEREDVTISELIRRLLKEELSRSNTQNSGGKDDDESR